MRTGLDGGAWHAGSAPTKVRQVGARTAGASHKGWRMTAADLFRSTYSRDPRAVYAAPGRVNLIGEHTDYTGGLVLPFAIDAHATLAVSANADRTIRLVSAQRPGAVVSVAVADLAPSSGTGWPAYLLGAVWSLTEDGHPVGGVDVALDSTVPSGAGLSSSAAIECVTVLAVADLHGVPLSPLDVARIAQRAENDYVGVPCGPMDQTASAASRAGSVLFFDTRAHTVEHIPFDPAAHGLAVLVIDTRVAHALADGEYARRRADCERAARILAVDQLRDVTPADLSGALARLDDERLRRRVRHVVTENERVRDTAAELASGRIAGIGDLLTASHASLRDDYEVSCPELDVGVQAAIGAGALGARMTGGGFGGSFIALLPRTRLEAAVARVSEAFAAHGFAAPVARSVTPAAGAHRVR